MPTLSKRISLLPSRYTLPSWIQNPPLFRGNRHTVQPKLTLCCLSVTTTCQLFCKPHLTQVHRLYKGNESCSPPATWLQIQWRTQEGARQGKVKPDDVCGDSSEMGRLKPRRAQYPPLQGTCTLASAGRAVTVCNDSIPPQTRLFFSQLEGALLAGLGRTYGCHGSNPAQLHARQVPYLTYYDSGPGIYFVCWQQSP